MPVSHIDIVVTGKVQGVHFRANTVVQANRLKIKGFVRNQSDGSVYIEAEGDEEQLSALAAWCKIGPPKAQVDDVSITAGEVKNYTAFETRY